jgi:putative two-component system hydrogenase maturation factor HypX/HoxX
VTVLQANDDVDAGDVWATRTFPVRGGSKSGLYRHEVRRAAIEAIVEAVGKFDRRRAPAPLDPDDPRTIGRARPLMTQDVRAIDWQTDATATVLRKLRAAEGHPGVLDEIGGTAFHLFGGHEEGALRGAPGQIVAQRDGAICRATVDGAVWITTLKQAGEGALKLPATLALERAGLVVHAPERPVPVHAPAGAAATYREIAYEEDAAAGVGYLRFTFHNGAMSTEQCRRLQDAYAYARSRRETSVIVLLGGRDFFSNGIHLNVIEAADDPAGESWLNLHAIDDVVRDIIETDSHLVVSALAGDAAAGGVPLALAADQVIARDDVVLNPYYQHMGGLYGSEYWTYLLPRRVGAATTARLVGAPFTPVGAHEAMWIGLIDAAYGATAGAFETWTRALAARLAERVGPQGLLEAKRRRRACDEHSKPLRAYRNEEMARTHACFFGPDRSYHEARHRFCLKLGQTGTVVREARPAARGVANATHAA